MERIILIQSGFQEKSLAVVEDGKVVEFHAEKLYHEKLVGNIYLGRVVNVLPGMQAAFVDLGLGRNALLHAGDIHLPRSEAGFTPGKRKPGISDLVKEGQDILVQVVKDAVGAKGPRITTKIALPGRFLVFMPYQHNLFISRRIRDEAVRAELQEMARRLRKDGVGLIVRTVAQEAGWTELLADYRELEELWHSIREKASRARSPAVIHRDAPLLPALLKDLVASDVDRILVNTPQVKEEVKGIVSTWAPHLADRVVLQETDLLELFHVHTQLAQALGRKVWLNCGGYLIIDGAEALTVIDVNTGRFTGTTNLAETALKVNLEAAAEIGRQLRLRNIGGMIVVDFVDMPGEKDWEQVLEELERQAQKDRVKTQVLGLTKLGLVEISRKKTNRSLAGQWLSNCPYCKGHGRVLKIQRVAGQALEKLFQLARTVSSPLIAVHLNTQVALFFLQEPLAELEAQTGKEILVVGRPGCHREYIHLEPAGPAAVDRLFLPFEAGQVVRWKGVTPAFLAQYGVHLVEERGEAEPEAGCSLEVVHVDAAGVQARRL